MATASGCAVPTTDASANLGVSTTAQAPLAQGDYRETGIESMPRMAPSTVRIPAIGAESELLELGLQSDGTVEVPPVDPGAPAGWYTGSPVPGEIGPSILLGHVNATDGGAGVFAGLRDLEAGDIIEVSRSDNSLAVFRYVDGEQYSKENFPSERVYGNTPNSALRLITCDGYNEDTGTWDDNFVVYADLIEIKPE